MREITFNDIKLDDNIRARFFYGSYFVELTAKVYMANDSIIDLGNAEDLIGELDSEAMRSIKRFGRLVHRNDVVRLWRL